MHSEALHPSHDWLPSGFLDWLHLPLKHGCAPTLRWDLHLLQEFLSNRGQQTVFPTRCGNLSAVLSRPTAGQITLGEDKTEFDCSDSGHV